MSMSHATHAVLRLVAAAGAAFAVAASALAQGTAPQVVEYYHLDALGSVRAVSNASGQLVERHDYLPFGEECTTGNCAAPLRAAQPRQFTGKERDAETGLDYFGARYYGSRIARFTTVDPVYTWTENFVDPQRWNRHAYSRNNPLRFTDPDGRIINDAALQNNRDYQKWKADYLSQEGAQSQWNALNDDPGITVNISWDSRGMSSVTDGYVWDETGKLTTVNVTLAAKTGNISHTMNASDGYVYGSTIKKGKERRAYVFAHELAHVEYAQTAAGRAALQQRDQDVAFLEQRRQELGFAGYTSSSEVSSIHGRVVQGALERDIGADKRAWEVLGNKP
jgi:RHS repeat-associated protein